MSMLKCTACPVYITNLKLVEFFELRRDSPKLAGVMDKAGCPECGAPMREVESLDDGYNLDESLNQWLKDQHDGCRPGDGCGHARLINDQLAWEAAEYIVSTPHLFQIGHGHQSREDAVGYVKRELLDGHPWVSWLDDRVVAALRHIHGEPTGDARFLLPEA